MIENQVLCCINIIISSLLKSHSFIIKHEEIKNSFNEQLNSKIRELENLRFNEFISLQSEKIKNLNRIKKEIDRTILKMF